MAKYSGVLIAALTSAAVVLLPCAGRAEQPTTQVLHQDSPNYVDELAASKALRGGPAGAIIPECPSATVWSALLPELSGPTLSWIAVVVILVLTLQTRPLLCWHNLDGLALALASLLLPLRGEGGVLPRDSAGHAVQWWAYLLLTLVGLYWLARGLKLLLARSAPALAPNVAPGGLAVLVVAGLCIAGSHIRSAPLSAASRDGLAGGICLAQTGKLPYGDAVGHDARSPLLYLLHAGAVTMLPPTDAQGGELRWGERSRWLADAPWAGVDAAAARLVNASLFGLFVLALAGIGHRFHSVALGQTLVAIVCVFPGALECFARPDIMLPTTLLAWSLALVMVPGVGGLLSVFLLFLAGLAWPWAWLALPALLAFLFRRGWQALGATLGLLGAVALTLAGLGTLVAPALPRAGGALREAGLAPAYTARLAADGTVIVEQHQPEQVPKPIFIKSRLWRALLEREDLRLTAAQVTFALPNGIDAGAVRFRDIAADDAAREQLQHSYRAALSREAQPTRIWTALRTLLESTWKPELAPAPSRTGTWDLWAASYSASAATWTWIRRGTKIVVLLLAFCVALVLLRRPVAGVHQLVGGLLALSAATLLASMGGAATNWVWLMPTALGVWAVKSATGQVPQPVPSLVQGLPELDLGPAPRITIER